MKTLLTLLFTAATLSAGPIKLAWDYGLQTAGTVTEVWMSYDNVLWSKVQVKSSELVGYSTDINSKRYFKIRNSRYTGYYTLYSPWTYTLTVYPPKHRR